MPVTINSVTSFSDSNDLSHKQNSTVSDKNPMDEKIGQKYCRQLFALYQDGIFFTSHGRIVHANRPAITLSGASGIAHLSGRPLDELLVDESPGDIDESQGVVTGDGENISFTKKKLQRLDGRVIHVEVLAAPCHESGEIDSLMIVHDISERNQAAAAVHLHDRHLQLITNAIPALMAYVGKDERYCFVNAFYETWFACARTDVIGRTISDMHEANYANMQPYIARALGGERVNYELTIRHGEDDRNVAVVYTPDIADDGSVRGFSSMMLDITEHKHGEQVLREQEKQLRLMTDAVPVFIAQCDTDYRLRFINKTYAERFGFRPEDMIGRRIPDIAGEEAFALFRHYLDAALAGKAQEHEIKIPFPGIGDHYMHLMYVPECDEHGHVNGLIATISDITRLRRTEEQLHRREQEFKTLVENSPDGISRIDRNMRHIYVNPAVEAVTGLHASHYLGKTKTELGMPSDLVHAWDSAVHAAFESGVEQRFDFELAGAQPRYFSARVIPEPDRDGQIESVLVITYDVTERTKMEKEHEALLSRERHARIQAETAARARDEFLAIVSHELRAPLNGIQSWAHILENYVKDATAEPLAQRALNGIKKGVAQQVRLIEDLLDATRMMSGKLRLVKQPFTLLPVIQAAVESVRGIAAAKHIGMTCTYQITTEQIYGDSDRVQQAIWNLLTNAIKFTSQNGNVWLTAGCVDSKIMITVRDDGAGISPDFLPHLFDRFSQEDTSSTRGHSGLGLGLFLVRYLIELHGGSVKADSLGEGKGAIFSISLPLRAGRDKYTPAIQAETGENIVPLPSLAGLHVLLVDDQEEARESLTLVLLNAGAKVFAASSAKEVFDWLPAVELDDLPDILVSDIAMPIEDGYSVLRKLRTWETSHGFAPLHRLPALALTAFAQREDRIRALTAGFQMHMTKPVAPEELIVVIAMMASRG